MEPHHEVFFRKALFRKAGRGVVWGASSICEWRILRTRGNLRVTMNSGRNGRAMNFL